MLRDINKLRDLENGDSKFEDANRYIIQCKQKIAEVLENDPDIKEILNRKTPKPLNKYKDANNPAKEELEQRAKIITYNENIKHQQIVPWVKLNGIQTEVLNFIMFDIQTESVYGNDSLENMTIWVYCLVHEADMDTEYGIPRTDLLDWLVKDNLNLSNVLGNQLKVAEDNFDIVDQVYYTRVIQFKMVTSNGTTPGNSNKYDRFTRV